MPRARMLASSSMRSSAVMSAESVGSPPPARSVDSQLVPAWAHQSHAPSGKPTPHPSGRMLLRVSQMREHWAHRRRGRSVSLSATLAAGGARATVGVAVGPRDSASRSRARRARLTSGLGRRKPRQDRALRRLARRWLEGLREGPTRQPKRRRDSAAASKAPRSERVQTVLSGPMPPFRLRSAG